MTSPELTLEELQLAAPNHGLPLEERLGRVVLVGAALGLAREQLGELLETRVVETERRRCRTRPVRGHPDDAGVEGGAASRSCPAATPLFLLILGTLFYR